MPRILIAVVVGLVGLALYVAIVLRLADRIYAMDVDMGPWPFGKWMVEGFYFFIAGTIWVIPIRRLMFWAARKSPSRT